MKRLPANLVLLWVVLAPSLAAAQVAALRPANDPKASDEDQPPLVKLVLHPAAEPRPALKYLLLPPLIDQRPGNAAVLYGKVTAGQRQFFGDEELWEKIVKWLDTPLEELPKEVDRGALHGPPVKFLERAARCEYVDWQLPIREKVFYEILLPEVQQTRDFGRLLAAKARLHVAEGEFDEAVHTLQTGYALGRHVGQGQTIINGLIGMVIAKTMSKQVEAFVQQPDAPNLYWALTHLPDPVIDMRPGLGTEWAMLYFSYPELRDLEGKDYSPEQWRERLNKLAETIFSLDGGVPPVGIDVVTTALALKGYPLARQGLIEQGYRRDQVEAMPVPKVILLYTMQTYEELRDDLFKWFAVPYYEAREGMDKAEGNLRDGLRREVVPLASILLPALHAAHRADANSRRNIAVLRVIEAIRLYGAAHDGKLPNQLSDITDVPVPIDPTTGKPFVYQRNGSKAVLESPGDRRDGLRYEITFAPKGK
ncbi:MAG: hypothetical protein ACYSWU_02500 [Planctomycetota bacterium]|jgi:hypothetical protein